jgi:hypothetical protein
MQLANSTRIPDIAVFSVIPHTVFNACPGTDQAPQNLKQTAAYLSRSSLSGWLELARSRGQLEPSTPIQHVRRQDLPALRR